MCNFGKDLWMRWKICKDVLIRLTSWDARNRIYQKRKELPFKVAPDLTNMRSKLLEYAKYQTDNDPRARELVDFVFCDINCKLKVFSSSKKFFAFNSEAEFLNF